MWTSARTFCSAESAASFKFNRWLIATCYSVISRTRVNSRKVLQLLHSHLNCHFLPCRAGRGRNPFVSRDQRICTSRCHNGRGKSS